MILETPTIRVTLEALELADIPKEFWKHTIQPHIDNKHVLALLQDFRAHLLSNNSALISGPFCTGKTAFACILARMALSFGASVRFIRAFDVYETWVKSKYELLNSNMVILDDLGAEEYNSKAAGVLEYLIRRRYESKMFTVVTTNLTPSALKDRYRGAFISVLLRSCGTVVLLEKPFQKEYV